MVRITTLVENTKGEHLALRNEHGISFFIENDGHTILFDTGQSDAFLYNADQLKIDLSGVEWVVLSHGHYDHSGGFRHLTELTSSFDLVIGRGFFDDKYAYGNNSYEYLGNNFDEGFLKDRGIRYRYMDNAHYEPIPGVHVVTDFARNHKDEVVNPRFRVMRDGKMQQDLFTDEVLIAVETLKGVVVLLGCSHPGMRNMVDTVKDLLEKPIFAVLGGTHLVEAEGPALDHSIDYLQREKIQVIGVSHCTGKEVMSHLSISNERYFHNRTGSSLIIE
jgi:7,8-dihydropterin-6-yl-methyl-4-(beta-D-ribofuranosyl)aminobenzene 5'-phosphate synthase